MAVTTLLVSFSLSNKHEVLSFKKMARKQMPVSSFVTAATELVLLCLWALSAAYLGLEATITEVTKKRLGSKAISGGQWINWHSW